MSETPKAERQLVRISWEETIVKTATFDVTNHHRSNGWTASGVVIQRSPIDSYESDTPWHDRTITHDRHIERAYIIEGKIPQ